MGFQEAHRALSGKVAVVVGYVAGFIGRGVSLGLAELGEDALSNSTYRKSARRKWMT